MFITVAAMTLQDVLKAHNKTMKDIETALGCTRQQAWNLWHGYTGAGKKVIAKLHENLNISLEELIKLKPVKRSKIPKRRHKENGE
jgi:transcriptional regulator with XRE-family HTH domain